MGQGKTMGHERELTTDIPRGIEYPRALTVSA
jgi:hypothetical protein